MSFVSRYWYPVLSKKKAFRGCTLSYVSPRARYYIKSHKRRWEKSRNVPYPITPIGEVGTIGGVRFLVDVAI